MGGGRSKWVSDSQAERETLPLNVPCLKEGSVRNPQISGEFGGLKLHNFFFLARVIRSGQEGYISQLTDVSESHNNWPIYMARDPQPVCRAKGTKLFSGT